MGYFAALNPLNLLGALPGCIAQGIIWGIMALGVYVTFRLLDFADLTVDGSFATGGAVTVMLTLAGVPVPAALLVAMLAGLLAGLVTGLLHTYLGIPPILSGILTQIALYSVNLHIMGMAANMALSSQKYQLLVSLMNIPRSILVGGLLAAALIALLYWYFGTEQGSAIRATGCNPSMSKANGININFTKVLALALSNGLVGLAGGLMAQYQGFSDINMGRGAIVIGLAAVIIGEVLGESVLRKRMNFALRLVFVIMGGIIYYVVVGVVLWLKLNSNDLKLFTAIIVAAFLAVPYLQGKRKNSFGRTAKASLSALETRKDREK
ncbi:MAG: ABC transporter permease [Lachnospiraceae bacterium]